MLKYPAPSTRLLVNVGVIVRVYVLPRKPVTDLAKLMTLILVHIQVIQDMPVGAVNRHLAYKIVVKSHTWKIQGNYESLKLWWQLYVCITSASNFESFSDLSFIAQSIQATNLHILFYNWKWSWPTDISKDTWEHVLYELVRTPLKSQIHLSESE